jgi:hypothetical protein
MNFVHVDDAIAVPGENQTVRWPPGLRKPPLTPSHRSSLSTPRWAQPVMLASDVASWMRGPELAHIVRTVTVWNEFAYASM